MATHPLWRPFELPTQEEIDAARARVGTWRPVPVEVVAPDPVWPRWFEVVRDRIEAALGERALAVGHVGSTAVPGLWAKPVVDVDLTVADSGDEDAWLPDLANAGFELRVRQPEWEEHRVVRSTDPPANVHVWSPGSREVRRHVLFRDWLREHPEDRELYAQVKREVAARGFEDQMAYNNEKAWVVYDIYERAFAGDPAHVHDPHHRRT